MAFLPIVGRELRVTARHPKTYLGRSVMAGASVVIAGLILPTVAAQFSITQGKTLFSIFSTLAFGYCLLIGVRVTADCLSSEKREGTLGLLFLTDLRGYDIVLGKLVSCSITALYGLFATVPVMALALLLGGVTLDEVGRMALLFANTLFFSAAAGVLASTLSRNDRRAAFGTFCLILGVTGLPFALALGWALWLQHLGTPPNSPLELMVFVPSPLFAFQLLRSILPMTTSIREFYYSIAATHLTAWIFLSIASLAIPRLCRERPPGRKGLRWLEFRNRWSYGNPVQRRAFRKRLLDRNPFYWLAARDRIKAYYVWFFVSALAAIWWVGSWLLPNFIFDWDVSICLLFLFFVFFKVWLCAEVCSRLVEDRASGAFELLLSSPLDLKEIGRGQSLALRRQFGRPILLVLGLTSLLVWNSLKASHDGISEVGIELLFSTLALALLADLLTLKWVGLWQAIHTDKINRAISDSLGRVLLLPTIISLVFFGAAWLMLLGGGIELSSEAMWLGAGLLWLAVGLLNDLFFGVRARWHFLHHFREVATQRFTGPAPALTPFIDAFRHMRDRVSKKPRETRPQSLPTFRWTHWLVRGPVILLLSALIIFGFWRRGLHHRLEIKLQSIKAAGEPTTMGSLQRSLPVVADAENAGLLLKKASPYLWSLRVLPRMRLGSKSFDWPGRLTPLTPEFTEQISNLVATNRPVLDLLHRAASLKKCRYPLDWTIPQRQWVLNIGFSSLQRAVPLLEFEALLALEAKDQDTVLRSIRTLFAFAHSMSAEPFNLAQYDRRYALDGTVRVLERLLHQQNLPEAQLSDLQRLLREAERATGPVLAHTFVMERCMVIDEVQGSSPSSAWTSPAPGLSSWVMGLKARSQHISGLFDRTLLETLQVADSCIRFAQQIETIDPNTWPDLRLRQFSGSSLNGVWPNPAALASYWYSIVEDHVAMILRLRTARTALAVERFRLVNQGRLPTELAELVPNFLPEIPVDLFASGAPLHYKRLNKGYVIYSVGRDRIDNQGVEDQAPGPGTVRLQSDITFTVDR